MKIINKNTSNKIALQKSNLLDNTFDNFKIIFKDAVSNIEVELDTIIPVVENNKYLIFILDEPTDAILNTGQGIMTLYSSNEPIVDVTGLNKQTFEYEVRDGELIDDYSILNTPTNEYTIFKK
jgi:hypothetical protein